MWLREELHRRERGDWSEFMGGEAGQEGLADHIRTLPFTPSQKATLFC